MPSAAMPLVPWAAWPLPSSPTMNADLLLTNARITTLVPGQPEAEAVAIRDGTILAVGRARDLHHYVGDDTTVIDAEQRRVIPGLHDSHTHLIRGGLNYNMELRWDGVRSLADAMAMLRAQVMRTPAPQWVRVVGGFTEHQFAEKRLPTLAELNAVAPETPVFILHLYDRALLNRAALRAVGYGKDTPNPPGGEIQRDEQGEPTGLLLAKPNALILYATLAAGPKLPYEYQINSTRHFMRELNRLGVTSVIDAGGGFQNYPDDYRIIEELASSDQLTVRIAYNLFTQSKGAELADSSAGPAWWRRGTAAPCSSTTGPARCWSSARRISRISANPAPNYPQTSRVIWPASSAIWLSTAGPSASMRPTTRASAGFSMSTRP